MAELSPARVSSDAGRAARELVGVEAIAEIGPRMVSLIGASSANRRVAGLGAADAKVAAEPRTSANAIRAPMAEPLCGYRKGPSFAVRCQAWAVEGHPVPLHAPAMTKMFKIALPDGSVREMPEGSTPADVAAAIGPGLAKAALAAKVDGEVRDIMRPFEGDASLALITSRDEKDALELVRHDYAHVLAEAVQNLFPGTQITFGPATEDGFYYDFAPTAERGPFTDEDLPAIEEEMRRVIAADKPLVREVWDRARVRQFFIDHGETSRPSG